MITTTHEVPGITRLEGQWTPLADGPLPTLPPADRPDRDIIVACVASKGGNPRVGQIKVRTDGTMEAFPDDGSTITVSVAIR